MLNTIRGRVLYVGQRSTMQTRSGQPFAKRELVIDCTRHDPYTGVRGFENTPCIAFTQDRCAMLDNIQLGSIVDVTFDVVGRKVTDPATNSTKFYNDIRGVKIDVVRIDQQPDSPTQIPYPITTATTINAATPPQQPAPAPVTAPQQAYVNAPSAPAPAWPQQPNVDGLPF